MITQSRFAAAGTAAKRRTRWEKVAYTRMTKQNRVRYEIARIMRFFSLAAIKPERNNVIVRAAKD